MSHRFLLETIADLRSFTLRYFRLRYIFF